MPETRPRPPHPSRLRRVWRHTWRITIVLVTLLLVAVLACSFDDELLDTSALRYEPRQIPDFENAFLVLAAAAGNLEDRTDLEFARLLETIRGTSWDDAEVDAWLQGRESAAETIRTLRRFQAAQAPIAKDVAALLAEQPRIDLLGALAAVEIRRLHRSGRRDDALSLALEAMHAVRLLGQSRGDMTHHIHAFRMDEATLEAVFPLASDPETPAADLARLREALSLHRPLREAFTQALAADYRRCEMLVAAYDDQDLLPSEWRAPASRSHFLPYRLPFLFKPRQTLNYAIPFYLFSVDAIDAPYPKRKVAASVSQHSRVDLCAQYDDLVNRWGKRFAHDGLLPSLDAFLDHRLRQQTRISLAEALIALRLYHDDHDRRLPLTLAELIPAYLPAVPRDYFDGEAVKYARDLHALWSAGTENFQPTDADQDAHPRELILPICFDGSYHPWPRFNPDRRFFTNFAGSASGESDEH